MAGIFGAFAPRKAGRPKHEPARDTVPYAKLQNVFSSWSGGKDRPVVKATPSNLRRFAKTVYARRAMRVVKDSIATRDWEIRPKKGVDINPEIQRQIDVVTACFNNPNNDDSHRSFIEQLVEDIGVTGAGCFEQQIGGDALRPLWMWPVDALSIQIVAGWDGSADKARYWQSLGYGNVGTQQGKPLRNDELVYIRSDPSTDTPFGLGWVEVAFNSINRILSTGDYAGNVAGNAQPANMLFFKGATTDQIEAFRVLWQNEFEGQGKTPMVGGEEAKVLELRGSGDDVIPLKYMELLVREIACASGVSPQNLSVERDVNRDTAEVAEDRDWRQTIIPTATLISSYINRDTIERRLGFSQIEHRFIGLDREDELDTAKILDYRWKDNSITVDEYRAKFGEPPMDNMWGPMTRADVEIAIKAAQGAKEVDDPALHQPTNPDDLVRRNRKKPKGS